MKQHINLLRSERAEARDPIQLPLVAACLSIVLLATAGTGWLVRDRLAASKEQAREARAAKLADAQRTSAVIVLDSALDSQLARARSRLARLEGASAQLREIDSTPGLPFSDLFDALARRTLDGVWLVGLTADGPAQRLTITARAIDAERVAPYLKQLNHETLLRDRRFQAMVIQERELQPGNRIVEFQLSTSPITRRGS
ncbi:MAG: PilN domain-containing protein [Burkholderiaceae bacterium]|nr:PilN domain-containing protein [Burkholderiaceae bacterium]